MSVRRPTTIAVGILALALLAACTTPAPGESPSESPGEAVAEGTLVLTAPEADADGYLPDSARGNVQQYCGDGDNVSPLLEWTGVPEGTESFVLLMTDPNYPSYIHWVVTGIPGEATALPAAADGQVEVGVVGTNSRGAGNYVGPCQPDNGYLYTLYALDAEVVGDATTTLVDATALMEGHVLAEAAVEARRR